MHCGLVGLGSGCAGPQVEPSPDCSRTESHACLAFARAVGEFGSVVLISGNIPFHTQVASVFIFSHIESDDVSGAAAVSVVLLVLSLLGFAGLYLGRGLPEVQ